MLPGLDNANAALSNSGTGKITSKTLLLQINGKVLIGKIVVNRVWRYHCRTLARTRSNRHSPAFFY